MTLAEEIVVGLEEMETDLGEGAVFTFNGTEYQGVPSVNEYKRDLDAGGFVIEKMLTISTQLKDEDGDNIFDVIPVAQQFIQYNGENFRILNTKKHATGAVLRITAVGTTRGI